MSHLPTNPLLSLSMPGRSLLRMPLNALSDSEGEDEGTEGRVSAIFDRHILTRSSAVSRSSSSVRKLAGSSNHSSSNNVAASTSANSSTDHSFINSFINNDTLIHQSNSSLNSSQMHKLLVQESWFDSFRWFIWRYIYLKIIQWISFDVWLLSKLRGHRKTALLLFLLPLMAYLSYCAIIWADASSLFPLSPSSAIFQKVVEAKTNVLNMCSLSLSIFSGFFSAVKKSDKSAFCTPVPYAEPSHKASISQEKLESLVQELEKRLRLNLVQDVKEGTYDLQEEMADLRQQVKLLQQYQNDQKLERSSKDVESHAQEIYLVNKQLKHLEEQQISFGNNQKLEKSSSSKGIEKVSTEQEQLNRKLKILEEKFVLEKLDLADFIASIEKHIVSAFRNVVDADKTSAYFFFNEWLNSKSTETVSPEIKIVVERLVKHYLHTLKSSETPLTTHLSDEGIRKIVRDAIHLYDADKTGLVDYALESAGGSVVSIRCSESYTEKNGKFSLFGFPLWSDQNSPRTAIQPDVHPGRCWSFKGSHGFLVIQLSYAIRPTGFTLEHIPVTLSPTGSIDSAPREFSVWGLASETDTEGTLLGHYSYDDKGPSLQYFIVQNSPIFPISYVELKILSNHGNLDYTCLYRFRVHGIQVN